MNTLVIVDCQQDFILKNAPLYVEGGIEAVANIKELLLSGQINSVIFTVDWHPINHCSFTINGGLWPNHCIQYTSGASIIASLYNTCINCSIPFQVLEKGADYKVEEYGAISKIVDKRSHYELYSNSDMVYLNKRSSVIVCGVAGDYCVLETLKQLKPLLPKVFLPGIASIDGGTKINNYIKENNIPVV